ncbi:MAG: glutathione S-transferase family protein [Pseudomonadota bacterium]
MKLYDYTTAPNPRRVRVFIAEKGIEVEKVNVDIMAGEHKTPEFLNKNINGQIPVLELDDGTCIAESVSICRYLEAIHPEPPLFGSDPVQMALIDMHLRRVELQLFRSIGTSWVNGPVVAKVAAGRFKQIPEAKEQSDAATHAYYKRMDKELGERSMLAGEEFSAADISAMCMIDFAEQMVGLPPSPELANLSRWRQELAARPSAQA